MEHLVVPSCQGILDCFNTQLSRYYQKESFCCLQGKADNLLLLALFSYIYLNPECSTTSSTWSFKVSGFKKYIGYTGGGKSKDLYTLLLTLENTGYMWDYEVHSKVVEVSFNAEKTMMMVKSYYFFLLYEHMQNISSTKNKWGKVLHKGKSSYSSMVYTSILKERVRSGIEVAIELVKLIERRGPLQTGETAHISLVALMERCPTLYQQINSKDQNKEKNRIMKNAVCKGMVLLKENTSIYECFEDLQIELPIDFSVGKENKIIIKYLRRNFNEIL